MMTSSFRSALTSVWALLSIMTIASWWTGSRSDGRADTLITAGVLLFALVKSRLVMRYFMEVRFAPRWLRLTCDVWLIMVFGMVFALYLGPL
jgi:heme/copper-type cytochrome/quinol oxidase subunit 4